MSHQTFVVTYLRTSPVHVPCRDMVLGLADSLSLDVQVMEQDTTDALPLDITGGIGGPVLQMLVWPDWCYRYSWDYGAPLHSPHTLLWSGIATVSSATPGTFTISFPTATMSSWPRRCAYALQLDEDGGGSTTLLAAGHLNLARSAPRVSVEPLIMLTDPTPPVLTDTGDDFILINGTLP